jgi:integrase
MPLTNTAILAAKPAEKPYKLPDEKGLFLLVHPNGSKYWRQKYRLGGKEKMLAHGIYPDVGLKDARTRRDEARKLLANDIDPGADRKAQKSAKLDLARNSFEAVACAWYERKSKKLAESTKFKMWRRLELYVLPVIGARPVSEIVARDMLDIVRAIEAKGALEIAKRMHNTCGRISRYAVTEGLVDRNPTADIDLCDVLAERLERHHASIRDPKEVGGLLRAIDGFTGAFTTRCAMKLAAYTFVRPGELRHAEWSEFDFDKAEWRVPGPKMKMKELHIVPLSTQAIAVFLELKALTGNDRYCFPGERSRDRPMSENTVNAALRRMGFSKEEMTGHGFRSTASTLLHEMGWTHAVIERQLAHGERNKVAAAYNFAEYLPDRRKMMQAWADYLDKLKAGAEVIPLHGNAALAISVVLDRAMQQHRRCIGTTPRVSSRASYAPHYFNA